MSLDLQVQTNPVAANFCFNGFNSSSWLDIVALLYVRFPDDFAVFNFGDSTPAPDKRDRPWFRTNADGTPDKWYVYAMGAWLSKHPVAEGTVIFYEGAEGTIDTFDGGEAGVVSTISGPMWEKVSELDARFPIGPGTFPSTDAVAVGDQGGEEKHALTAAENGPHTHQIGSQDSTADVGAAVSQEFVRDYGSGTGPAATTSSAGSGDPHKTIPPYYAMFALRKTARQFYRV